MGRCCIGRASDIGAYRRVVTETKNRYFYDAETMLAFTHNIITNKQAITRTASSASTHRLRRIGRNPSQLSMHRTKR